MLKFKLDRVIFANAPITPSGNYIYSVVKENNDKINIYLDPETNDTIIECQNKPRDLPMFGVHWLEVE